jgi:beta-lactamase class C
MTTLRPRRTSGRRRGSKLARLRAILAVMAVAGLGNIAAANDKAVLELVGTEIRPHLPGDGIGGAAIAVHIDGRTLFLNIGLANVAQKRPITTDSLFNLASVRKAFEATVLAQAFRQRELAFDDPVEKYVSELREGQDIRRVTLAQLATHTSGLLLPPDEPPWPTRSYTLGEFIRLLNDWKLAAGREGGKQHLYSHAGYVLLQLALERRFNMPIAELIARRVTRPLGLASTLLPPRGADGRASLARPFMERAVQGYDAEGAPIGGPGEQESFYDFPGTGQMFSSARDLAVFLAANLGELPIDRSLKEAMQLAHRGVFRTEPDVMQALAWEVTERDGVALVDKPGGLFHASAYVGMVPRQKLGLVILINRGSQYPYEFGRDFLFKLARARAPQLLRAQGTPRLEPR